MSNDDKKKELTKKLVRLRNQSDVMWHSARERVSALKEAVTATDPDPAQINLLRIAAGIVLAELVVRTVEVEASKVITPEDENQWKD